MNKEKQYYEITDAFLALKDIDDDEIEGMLRNNKHVNEGKAFSISTGSKDLEAARQFIDEDAEADDEIEVIDVDADTVDHIKKNSEYIGQGILCCNRCKANRFIDMDLLVASEVDEEVYNIDDECPHCHDAGSGYTLLGQVGKVQKEEPEAVPAEPEAEVTNDEVSTDDATFENDLEADNTEEDTEEEVVEEEPEVQTVEEEPETDGMETETSEDELDDLDLPALGDEIDLDDVEEDDDENVKESLNEEVELNPLAEEAWMMNRVISSMNNEEAYYGSWLYIWPDGESREECAYDFGDHESFDELQETFLRTYKHYHADGLYAAAPEVVEYAHSIDSKLGLAKIENLEPVKSTVRESFDCSVAGDIFNAITSPEKVDKVIILDVSDEEVEPRVLFKGSREDVPMNMIGSPCKAFDVSDGYLSCNIDSDVENTNRPLSKALECFNDDKTDKVLVWDQAKGEEVFSGTKADACDKFGNCEFVSFETPAVIRISINNPGILSCDELDDAIETDVEKLVKKIIDANNLSQYKTDKPNTNEFWIKACLEDLDDVELIYESFVKPTADKELIKEFKAVTGYNNALEEAYEAGYAAATMNEDKEVVAKFAETAANYDGKGVPYKLDSTDADTCSNCGGELLASDADGIRKCKNCGNKYVGVQPLFCVNCGSTDIDVARDCKCKSCGHEFLKDGECPECGGKVHDGKCTHCSIIIEDVTLDQVKDEVDAAENASKEAEHEPEQEENKKENTSVQEQLGLNSRSEQLNALARHIHDAVSKVAECTVNTTPQNGKIFVLINDPKISADEVIKIGKDCLAKDSCDPEIIDQEQKDGQLIIVFDNIAYKRQVGVRENVKSFKSRKELADAVSECKNNSQPYTIRRSTAEGFRYDLITEELVEEDDNTALVSAEGNIEVIDDVAQEYPVEYTPEQTALMNELHRIALDTAEAIQRHYNIDADPAVIVADIIRDLQLISGNVSVDDLTDSVSDQATRAMFNSYNEFYNFVDEMISGATGTEFRTTPEQKLAQAIQMLHGPSFQAPAIDKAIGSRAFIAAAQAGNVPYIAASDIPLLTEALETKVFEEDLESEVCEGCGKSPCECVDPDLSESLEDLLSESVEVDTDLFDEEMNSYFDEAYEDTVVYTTTDGHVNEDGTIVLEGLLQLEEVIKPITFTLTPETKITEDVEDREAALAEVMSETFTVTNNISEEKFEFKFSK